MSRGMYPRPAAVSPFFARCEVDHVSFTVGADVANVIKVTLQLKDANDNNLAKVGVVDAYLSDNADGSTKTAVVPTTVAIATYGLALALVTGVVFKLVSDSSGRIDLNITKNTANNYYLVVVTPTGILNISTIIALT